MRSYECRAQVDPAEKNERRIRTAMLRKPRRFLVFVRLSIARAAQQFVNKAVLRAISMPIMANPEFAPSTGSRCTWHSGTSYAIRGLGGSNPVGSATQTLLVRLS